MSTKNVVLAWLITLVIGSLPAAFFIKFSWQGYLLVMLGAAICSTPYLVIFLALVRRIRQFIYVQLLHFVLAFLTFLVIAMIEKDFFYFPPIYFCCGIAVQAFVYFKNPLSSLEQEENILDS